MPQQPLSQLFAKLDDVTLPPDSASLSVKRVRDDSRTVEPGDLFVAIRGTSSNGTRHIAEAVARGAVAVVVDNSQPGRHPMSMDAHAQPRAAVVRVPDARIALAELAAAAAGRPADRLAMVGITGTVGKTSVLAMLDEILREAGIRAGTIGSLGISYPGAEAATTPNTTPGALAVQEALAAMVRSDVSVAAMEVTSHALVQKRVHGLRYDLGIFTNLTMLEHMEYHGSFRNYAAAKLRFLPALKPHAPLCFAAGDRAVSQAVRRHSGPRVSCGGGGAWVSVRRAPLSLEGTRITLTIRRPLPRLDGSCMKPVRIPLQLQSLGRPNTANATFAATAGLILGASPEHVQAALSAIAPTRRRLERVRPHDPIVLDDTVGHPDSISGIFELADRVQHRRLRVVFCVRGQRGLEINARDAEALAIWSRRVPIDRMVITSAMDTADERNTVSRDERLAFTSVLDRMAVPYSHHDRLDEAISQALDGAFGNDLLLLLGAQGMDAGAGIVRRLRDDS